MKSVKIKIKLAYNWEILVFPMMTETTVYLAPLRNISSNFKVSRHIYQNMHKVFRPTRPRVFSKSTLLFTNIPKPPSNLIALKFQLNCDIVFLLKSNSKEIYLLAKVE